MFDPLTPFQGREKEVEMTPFFVYTVKARGRANTPDRSGCNRQKQDVKHACLGWTSWTQRMHGVYEMDTEGNSKGKNWKIGRRRDLGGVNEGGKDHGFGLDTI